MFNWEQMNKSFHLDLVICNNLFDIFTEADTENISMIWSLWWLNVILLKYSINKNIFIQIVFCLSFLGSGFVVFSPWCIYLLGDKLSEGKAFFSIFYGMMFRNHTYINRKLKLKITSQKPFHFSRIHKKFCVCLKIHFVSEEFYVIMGQ